MNKKKAKTRYYSYLLALTLVAICAIYGMYVNFSSERVKPKTNNDNYSTDSSLTVKEKDTINIDMVGYVDGEEVENGSTKGKGWDVTVGIGKLMPEIEEQIIGHHPGDTFTVNVTFADDYKDKNLRGKEAEIEMTVHGIYVSDEE